MCTIMRIALAFILPALVVPGFVSAITITELHVPGETLSPVQPSNSLESLCVTKLAKFELLPLGPLAVDTSLTSLRNWFETAPAAAEPASLLPISGMPVITAAPQVSDEIGQIKLYCTARLLAVDYFNLPAELMDEYEDLEKKVASWQSSMHDEVRSVGGKCGAVAPCFDLLVATDVGECVTAVGGIVGVDVQQGGVNGGMVNGWMLVSALGVAVMGGALVALCSLM